LNLGDLLPHAHILICGLLVEEADVDALNGPESNPENKLASGTFGFGGGSLKFLAFSAS